MTKCLNKQNKKNNMKKVMLAMSAFLLFSCQKELSSSTVSISNDSVEAVTAVASLSYYYPQQYRYANSGDRKIIYADSVFASKPTYFKGLKMSLHAAQTVGIENIRLKINGVNIKSISTYTGDTLTIVPLTPTLVDKRAWYSIKANISGDHLTTYFLAWNELLLTKTLEDSNFIPVENVSMVWGLPCSPTEFR